MTSALSPFARDVRAGLTQPDQKQLPCRYFYDAVGSALFEAITVLPEYGLTRADARIIERHAGELIDALPGLLAVAELGSGSGTKTRRILETLAERQPVVYYPIDLSAKALELCAYEMRNVGTVQPIEAGYLEGLQEAACRRAGGQRLLLLFLGSTIGNFDRPAAAAFLAGVRALLRPGDALLLGADLEKPAAQLLAAYDDPAGVTAAFNRNLLARINRELNGDFDLRRFAHEARYNRAERRIEMHLRSLGAQTVAIDGARLTCEFRDGETIWTESCHKFHAAEVCEMAAGFQCAAQWTDAEWPFAETLLLA